MLCPICGKKCTQQAVSMQCWWECVCGWSDMENEEEKMNKVVFDVDGTLIDFENNPRYDIINLLISFHKLGSNIYVHSGCGEDYAKTWVRKLGLKKYVRGAFAKEKPTGQYDISFDDEEVTYGKVNIKV